MAASALMMGQKIEAIKIVREERGIELTNVPRNSSGFGWILLLIVLGILARYFLANQSEAVNR